MKTTKNCSLSFFHSTSTMFFNAIFIKTNVCVCVTVNGRNPVSVDMETLLSLLGFIYIYIHIHIHIYIYKRSRQISPELWQLLLLS